MDPIETPLGTLYATLKEKALISLSFTKTSQHTTHPSIQNEIEQYFAGTLKHFQTKLLLQGSPFQQRVWQELLKIPYGETRSYADIACAIGKPTATRAVANAIGKNPIALIVPCHRVIHKKGTLGGFREGIERKQWILSHEMLRK